MRFISISTVFLLAVLVSACDFWPRNLEALAESISQQTSGEATAWLASGDVLLITVTGSPLYRAETSELEARAAGLAEQAIALVSAPLESIAITFYEHGVSDDEDETREYIFLVMDGHAVLQPYFDLEATGPLTPEEIDAAIQRLGDTLADDREACVLEEVRKRAQAAGDPELLDPASVEFLTSETWHALDGFGKRLMLTQAITTEALFYCLRPGSD